ncbi:CACTA transposable element [Tanacetum coccineum]
MFICNAVMTIDKSWTTISNRNSEEFLDGLFAFIKHCKPLLHPITQKIHCPCSRCCNRDDNRVTLEILEVHISRYGFDQHYTTWKYHGEPILPLPPQVPHSPEHVDMDTFFEDISANNVPTPPTQTTGPQPFQTTGPNNEFEELLSRSTQKLYPGCDMSTLEFTTEISHIKALHKITDAGFNKILALLQKACPPSKGYNFPSSYYEIKKTYKKIGLGYESIHACINDCFLFWGSEDNLKMPNCPVCKASRWKDPKKTKGKKVANKVVRYFPLTPRLQRMFNTKHIAKWMTWHATGQSKENGKMNHPCDGRAWKYFDMMKPEFSGDPRNVRLGLAADGFNPFGMMSQNYSMWPVILTTYNTPPWMCMKETSLMLTMLIPGPRSPAKDIDVYLQPLIKELQELWKGVWMKDAATNTLFQEILELTYIGHRKVVLFRCKWFDTINPKNHTTRNRRSYIDQGIHHILTDREFHKNNQYILAIQETQVFYLQDLARQPRGWKVVQHVYHRDVAESNQDVIHGSSSSHVTLSIGLTCLEHTDLSINAQSIEVDAPSVNDDNANANEDNADFINNEDDVVAHVLDDDDVVVSDDDEVNPSTNVEEVLSAMILTMTINLKM